MGESHFAPGLEVGGADGGGDGELFEALIGDIAAQEVLKAVEKEETVGGNGPLGQVVEFQFQKEVEHVARRNAGGVHHGHNRPGADAGNDIGAQTHFEHGLNGAAMGKSAGTASAEGESDFMGSTEARLTAHFKSKHLHRALNFDVERKE